MTENIAKKSLYGLISKENVQDKDFLNYIYYDKDGYIISSNNYVLGAIKCDFKKEKKGLCENKDGNIVDNVKYPLWGHLFKGKSFNSVTIDYDKIDEIISGCKEKIKKLPKSKYKITPQPCELIKFGKTYFRIKHFESFIKICKIIKATELVYGGSDDRMMAYTKDGKVVINPLIWYNKENLFDEPIDYLTFNVKEIKKTISKNKEKNGKK